MLIWRAAQERTAPRPDGALRADQALRDERHPKTGSAHGVGERVVVGQRATPRLPDPRLREDVAPHRHRPAPGEVPVMVPEERQDREIPHRPQERGEARGHRPVEAVAGGDTHVGPLQLGDEPLQPPGPRPAVGIGEDEHLRERSGVESGEQVVHLLSLAVAGAGDDQVRAPRVSPPCAFDGGNRHVVGSPDHEAYAEALVLLAEKRLQVGLEPLLVAAARDDQGDLRPPLREERSAGGGTPARRSPGGGGSRGARRAPPPR